MVDMADEGTVVFSVVLAVGLVVVFEVELAVVLEIPLVSVLWPVVTSMPTASQNWKARNCRSAEVV